MARTYRNRPENKFYRHPRTRNEIRQIDAIMNDPELKEYNLAKPNRLNRYIPDVYDDIVISACFQEDFDK
jgi:hypothetical protein